MNKTKCKGGARKGAGAKPYATQLMARELVALGGAICLKAMKREGEYKDLDVAIILDLASRFAVKAIPTQIEGELLQTHQIVQVYLPKMPMEINGSERLNLEAPSRPSRELPPTNGS